MWFVTKRFLFGVGVSHARLWAVRLPCPQVNSESLPVASRPEGADSTGAAGVAAVTGATTAVLPTASAKKKIRDAKLVPKHIMEVKVQHHKIDKSRLQELFVESGPESKQKEAENQPLELAGERGIFVKISIIIH